MPFSFFGLAGLSDRGFTQHAEERMSDADFIVSEIKRFRLSKRFRDMWDGERYYRGDHDVLRKQRTAIGEDGELTEITNLPNNKIVDNLYRKLVEQKANYLCGQPFVIRSEDQSFAEAVKPYLQTRRFFRTLLSVTRDALNCGLGWLFPHYDESGELVFQRIRPFELIPEWADAEHTRLDAAIRVYQVTGYEGKTERTYDKVEVYDAEGIRYFQLAGGTLTLEEPFFQPYFTASDGAGNEVGYAWEKIPLIPFKYNDDEIPLLRMCRGLVDGLDRLESQWEDQMEEDPRNTILVLVNYDGENLGEFRKNLANYGAVKVRAAEGSGGDVRTLHIEVNAENYKSVIEQFRKSIIGNCMGYDAKDDRLGGNPNEMNLKSMYADIELDANGMESEFQSAFEELIWFLTCHLSNTGVGDFEGADYELIFNRDMLVNESDAISDIRNSVGILSTETLVAQHPWVDDVNAELQRLQAERDAAVEQYGGFGAEPPEE